MAANGLGLTSSSSMATASTSSSLTPYLKSYPYLFVRESDQTDYFCTICDAYLREEQLQSHLFDGHRADNLPDFFVKVKVETTGTPGNFQPAKPSSTSSTPLFICVVCWAKITTMDNMATHRQSCKIESDSTSSGNQPQSSSSLTRGIVQDGEPTKVISTPDIPTLMIDSDTEGNNHSRNSPAQSPRSSQGSLIIDLPDTMPQTAPAPPSLLAQSPATHALPPPAQPVKRGRKKQPHPQQVIKNVLPDSPAPQPTMDVASEFREQIQKQLAQSLPPLLQAGSLANQGPAFASNCIQCSLCGSILGSGTYMKHLREFHRVACSLETSCCPLCMGVVPLMDMTVHLAAMHGIAPQPAVNALLLWTLANNTFVMNEKTKESLKAKTIALSGGGMTLPSVPGNNGSFEPSGTPLLPPTASSSLPTILENTANSLASNSLGSKSSNSLLTSTLTPQSGASGPNHLMNGQPSAAAVQAAVNAMASARIPSFLQALLNGDGAQNGVGSGSQGNGGGLFSPKLTIESIVAKLTRNHIGQNNRESFQCLVCSKWFAVPPIKHMRGHIMSAREEKRRTLPLFGGSSHVCLVCYQIFESLSGLNAHLATIHPESDGNQDQDDLPLGATFETTNTSRKTPLNIPTVVVNSTPTPPNPPSPFIAATSTPNTPFPSLTTPPVRGQTGTPSAPAPVKSVELDNAGRVKSGKVRKQCELCGQWSNIKWFFKHMSEVHQALFCRCCREYLPIPEQEEHRKWHAEPPYMGQKIRIENGQPVIIDRKERASLTPIGSLASWGGSSGGMVVKAVDDGIVPQLPSSRKRKAKTAKNTSPPTMVQQNGKLSGTLGQSLLDTSLMTSPTLVAPPPNKIPHLLGQHHLELTNSFGNPPSSHTTNSSSPKSSVSNASNSPIHNSSSGAVKDTLMPKETCPVCGILITYKNLARHIKLRHKIKYKFCHKCRKLVPNDTYEQHKNTCKEILTPPSLDLSSYNHLTTTLSMDTGGSLSITPTTITTHLNPTPPAVSTKRSQIDASEFLDMNPSSSAVVVAQPAGQVRNANPESASATEQDEEDLADDDENEIEEIPIVDDKVNRTGNPTGNPNPTSKTKLDSLVGKEFKHPRRKCSICNYTVSYSNFKRHLRNAHPNEYNKFDSESEVDFGRAMNTLTHPMPDGEIQASLMGKPDDLDRGDDEAMDDDDEEEEEEVEEEEEQSKESNFITCTICGDHILEDFLERHMKLNHQSEEADEAVTDKGETEEEKAQEDDEDRDEDDEVPSRETRGRHGKRLPVLRECPVCSQEMRSELMIKHCKLSHKISCKWCNLCNKYLLKKHHRNHMKKHEKNEAIDPNDEEELVRPSSGNSIRINTRNNSVNVAVDESNDDEPAAEKSEPSNSIKIKNLNELMATKDSSEKANDDA